MSDNLNHYEVLGVQHDATLEQIIHAYKAKGADENPQDSPQISKEKMQAVEVAYDILTNPVERVEYDRTLAGVPIVHSGQAGLGSGQTASSLEENIQVEKEERSEKGKAVSVEEIVDGKVETQVAPHDAPTQSEIQPVGADHKVEAPVAPHDVAPKTEMQHDVSGKAAMDESDQWADAIKNGDHRKLTELLEKDKSCLWKYEKEGRTALTIAAEVNDKKLVELILEELLKAQREKNTYIFFQLLDPASVFDSLTDYIEKSDLLSPSSDFDSLTDYIKKSDPLNPHVEILELIQQKQRISMEERYARALEQRDWVTLLNMLDNREFFRICMDHGKDRTLRCRRTLLHVAAMHGCFPLVEKLLNKLTSMVETVGKVGKADFRDFIMDVDPRTGLTALQMADDIIGNRSISELIKLTLRFLKSSFENTFSEFVAHWGVVLFEAYPHTQWYKELNMYAQQRRKGQRGYMRTLDSAMLRHTLQQNSRLLLEAFHGLSALHLAMLFEDEDLVEAIKALFGPQGEIVWGDSYYPRALSWKQMSEARGLDGVEITNLYDFWNNLNPLPDYNISARKISELKYVPSRYINFNPEHVIITTSLPEHSPTFSAMNECINQEWQKVSHEEWQKGFEADADFNFEAEPRKSLLRVHHACKDPVQFQEFLKSVSEHENFNDFSTRMHDAQGRTLHHILLDHYTTDKLPGWAFTKIFSSEVSKFCIKHAQDSRGRRLIDVLIGKNCLQHNILLKPYSYFNMKFEQDIEGKENYLLFFGNYYIASALQQTIIASQPIWVEVLQAHLTKVKTLKLLPFVTATSTNQTMLQTLCGLIEPQVDLMVQDEKKRTLLHYAADPTSLKFETLLGIGSHFECSMIYNCFSTVQDYYEIKKKLSLKNDMGAMCFLNTLVPENEKIKNDMGIDHSSGADEKGEIRQSNVEKDEIVNARRKACILMLLQAGLDLSQKDNDKKVPSIGPTSDATYQTWWYDLVVKDATDNKNSFNQAGNALSVVGTLVAATSYIGPLQPPMSYTDGLVRSSEKLVDVFMVTNTLAFFLAMASVMFAVVPSLPMPRESVLSELRRARLMVSVSLCLLLIAIAAIIVSFSAASVVVRQHEHSFPQSNILLGPLLVGWSICFIAGTSFFIRILRLSFYENAIVRTIYQFSLQEFCRRTLKSYGSFLGKDHHNFVMIIALPFVYCFVFLDFLGSHIMVLYLGSLCLEIFTILSSLLLFPIYHVIHVAVLIPCRKLMVHYASFRRRHQRVVENSDNG